MAWDAAWVASFPKVPSAPNRTIATKAARTATMPIATATHSSDDWPSSSLGLSRQVLPTQTLHRDRA